MNPCDIDARVLFMIKVSENIKINLKYFEKGVDKCEKFDIMKLQKRKRNTKRK